MTNLVSATITKTAAAMQAGAYEPTSLDRIKADPETILETGFAGRRTEIKTRKVLSGKGVTLEAEHSGAFRYLVTEAALNELSRRFVVMTDF